MDDTKTRVKEFTRACFAEFFATSIFVCVVTGSVSAAKFSALEHDTGSGLPFQPVGFSLAIGLAITILAFAIGDISGGHMNPAVTLTLAITRNIPPLRAIAFMLSQTTGAIMAGGLIRGAIGKNNYHSGIPYKLPVTPSGGFFLEFLGTTILLFTVLTVAVWASPHADRKATQITSFVRSIIASTAPIPIGLSIVVAHLTIAPFTGCGINPARVVGAVFFYDDMPDHFWIYFIGPFLASCFVPLVYYALYGTIGPVDDNSESLLKSQDPKFSVSETEMV
jgi:MIP family channel proteins